MTARLTGFTSGTSLGGRVSRYRRKQYIYTQGERANPLFYIQEGGVRLITRTKHRAGAVTALLGASGCVGKLGLAGYPLRMSAAVALAASSIRTITKAKMLAMLRQRNGKT